MPAVIGSLMLIKTRGELSPELQMQGMCSSAIPCICNDYYVIALLWVIFKKSYFLCNNLNCHVFYIVDEAVKSLSVTFSDKSLTYWNAISTVIRAG